MAIYTVTLSDMENRALGFAALDQDQWIQNAIHERCRIAIIEIVNTTVAKCMENDIPVPPTKEEILALGFEKKWVMSVKERNLAIS